MLAQVNKCYSICLHSSILNLWSFRRDGWRDVGRAVKWWLPVVGSRRPHVWISVSWKEKAERWINKRTSPQGRDINDKRLQWMWGKWSTVTIQLEFLWRELGHTEPVTAAFCPRWLELQRWQLSVLLQEADQPVEIPKCISSSEDRKSSYPPLGVLCLPLNRGGTFFVSFHLVWCAGETGMKAIK